MGQVVSVKIDDPKTGTAVKEQLGFLVNTAKAKLDIYQNEIEK